MLKNVNKKQISFIYINQDINIPIIFGGLYLPDKLSRAAVTALTSFSLPSLYLLQIHLCVIYTF